MKLLRLLLAGLPAALLLVPGLALAGAPALQITPLQYEDTLSGQVKNGHIDVANPTDAPLHVEATVRRFKQQGTAGDLAFYDDSDLRVAIKLDLTSFDLSPHDAIRVLFSVDSSKLPAGGTYAAIFFRTIPADNPGSDSSYVSQSADIGTLLILTNGAAATPAGGVSELNVPFWQFGSGIAGSALIANSAPSQGGTAFRPSLTMHVLPWDRPAGQGTGLILPASSRHFGVAHPGSYIGLLPVTVTDAATHTSRTTWVFACTGVAGWVLLVLALTLLVLLVAKPFKRVPRVRLPRRAPVLALSTEAPAVPSPGPKVTKLTVQAEHPAPATEPEPPEPPVTPSEPARRVSVKVESEPKPEPQSKLQIPTEPDASKPVHKIKVQPQAKSRTRKPRAK